MAGEDPECVSSPDGALTSIPTITRTAPQDPTDGSVADLPGEARSDRRKYLSSTPLLTFSLQPPKTASPPSSPLNDFASGTGRVLATHTETAEYITFFVFVNHL